VSGCRHRWWPPVDRPKSIDLKQGRRYFGENRAPRPICLENAL
jgi:hypothetical protein